MRVTLPTQSFAEAVAYAAGVAAAKSPKRILECLAIRTEGKKALVLEATDLDVSVRLTLDGVKVEEEGGAVVPAARLAAILRELPAKEVTVVGRDGGISIDSDSAHYRVQGEDAAQFPVLPTFPQNVAFRTTCGVLRNLVRRTAFATAKEPGRYALHGVHVHAGPNGLDFVGTDGRRLARATAPLDGGKERPQEVKAIVGVKALGLVERLAADDSTPVDVALEERQVLFLARGTMLSARLVDGAFPSYEDVIPKASERGFSVVVGDFATALRRASLLTSRETPSVQLEIVPEKVTVSARATELGEAKLNLAVKYDGAAEKLGFNPGFLLDALKVMDPAKSVRFEFTNNKVPCRMTDGDDYVYVLAPLSVNE